MSNTKQAPKVGFVSLGCPKNLVDSERILTQLRTEGYDVVPSYDDAELVVVNTCGFIDSAVQESLEAIGEALAENGKVIVTGCLGAKENQIREIHPKVLEITGPHAYEEVLGHVHKYVEKPQHNPFTSLVPAHGVKLTPRHYAYLKISEGCNHRCTFCIIPSMRGDLVSRPIGDVLAEAKRLKEAGVKELLVISQDTSAYGVDVKHRTGFYDGMPVKTSMVALCEELAKLDIWVRLHYVYPYPHVDDVIPLMRDGKVLPYLDIPLQHASPRILKLMKRPGTVERTLERIQKWRESARRSPCAPPLSSASRVRPRKISRCCWTLSTRRSWIASAASNTARSKGRWPTSCRIRYRKRFRKSASSALWSCNSRSPSANWPAKWVRR